MPAPATILIVDDDPQVIRALQRIFPDRDYQVLSATQPKQALAILQQQPVDVILCDQSMPEMTGVELFKQTRLLWPDTLRILITGGSDLQVAIQAINEGNLYRYIAKPWKNEEVLAVIRTGLLEKQEKDQQKSILDLLTASMNSSTGNARKYSALEGENIVLINATDLIFLTADNGQTILVTKSGRYTSHDSLAHWENKLDATFFRCHRSYIVNLDRVEKIIPWFNGTYNLQFRDAVEQVPVSRNAGAKLLSHFEA